MLVALATLCAGAASAQEAMRPVPRFGGTSVRDARTETQKAAAKSNLQWRASGEVAVPAVAAPPVRTATSTQPSSIPASSSTSVSAARFVEPAPASANNGLRGNASPVLQARYQSGIEMPDDVGNLPLPRGLQAPRSATPLIPDENRPATDTVEPLPDFFSDPYGDEATADSLVDPAEEPSNGLRAPSLGEPQAPKTQTPKIVPEDSLPPPATKPRGSLADEFEKSKADGQAEPTAPSSDNPFDRNRSTREREADDADRRRLEDFDMPRSTKPRRREAESTSPNDVDDPRKSAEFSCDDFRKSIAESTIDKLSLDISPPFRPDVIEVDEFEKYKSKFDQAQEIRDWQSIDGRRLGRGRLRDLAYEKVVIQTEFGTLEELPIDRISEADLAYLSQNWGLPQECLIEQQAYVPRSWQHSKVTWKASNLCHKPLYFEEVNLERYGHTAGPFVQPVVSTAHFFFNIAVLPYKMGVHQPHECQYALGYYRPGNCAPWICPPIPISLRGGLYQAAAMTGAFWVIP